MKIRFIAEAFANMEEWLQSAVSKKMGTFVIFIEGFVLSLFTIPYMHEIVTFLVAIGGGLASMLGKDIYTYLKRQIKLKWPRLKAAMVQRKQKKKLRGSR